MFKKITDNWRIIAIAVGVIALAVGILYYVMVRKGDEPTQIAGK